VTGSVAEDGDMTNDTGTSTTAVLTAADDPRPLFARAVRIGGEVVAGVRPDQLGDPTPCDEYDVRTLLDHLLLVLRRVAAMGRGDDPFGPDVLASPTVPDDGWPAAWAAAAQAVEEAWADDWALARIIRLPWMEGNGATTLVVYLNELTVHTWDLAVATGPQPTWDAEVLALAFDGIRFLPPTGRPALFAQSKAQMPADFRDWSDPFADAVPVPDDAPLVDRLVAYNGRDVNRWSGRRP
jgi:uncharacterized protein (TIGR03086 family)